MVWNKSYGSGQRLLQLGYQWLASRVLRRFSVIRDFQGTTVPEFASQLGTVNASTFLGLSAGTCLYKGMSFTTNLSLSGTRMFHLNYQFESDSAGVVEGLPSCYTNSPQVMQTSSTSGSTASTWTNVSSLNLPTVVTPATSDFSVFLA